jgi:quercetin dioxygenase-like cupin family protein
MNIKDLHLADNGVATNAVFKTENSTAIALQILKGEQLKEHITKTPAFLLCVSGSVLFENEKGLMETMVQGDYMNIAPNVKHKVDGLEDSQLILVK